MNEILAIILKDAYSLARLRYRIRILKSTLLGTFFGGRDTNGAVAPEDLNWLKSLPTSFYQQFNKDNVYKIFADLDSQTAKLPVLTLYLTFEPDEVSLSQISAYIKQNFPVSALLLDIKLDPNLIAGTALVWKGVYKDYSLRSKIEGRKGEILQEFKKFLR